MKWEMLYECNLVLLLFVVVLLAFVLFNLVALDSGISVITQLENLYCNSLSLGFSFKFSTFFLCLNE